MIPIKTLEEMYNMLQEEHCKALGIANEAETTKRQTYYDGYAAGLNVAKYYLADKILNGEAPK